MPTSTVQLDPEHKLLVSAERAAAMLSISRSMLYSMHNSGRLGPLPIKLGGRSLWSTDQLARWVKDGCKRRELWLETERETNEK